MGRPLRIEHPGGWYHVTGRGNERRAIFRADRDRAHFLELLGQLPGRFGVAVCAFALMDNHYHLLLRLREPQLSRAMQWLNLSYTLWFNRRHERCGHLFQGRFKSILFDPDSAALELSRYVHLNPARVAGLGLGKARRAATRAGADGAPKPEDVRARLALLRQYPWSSYRAFIGAAPSPPWLDRDAILSRNRGGRAQQREAYRQHVEAGAREGSGSAGVWAQLREGSLLGGERFLAGVRAHIFGGGEQRAAARLRRAPLAWDEIMSAVEKLVGKPWETLRHQHGDTTRDLALYVGRRHGGLKLRDLAARAGLGHYGAVAMAVRRYEDRLSQDARERGRLRALSQMLNVKM